MLGTLRRNMVKVLLIGGLLLNCPALTHAQSQQMPVSQALKKITQVFGTRFVYEKSDLRGKTTAYDLSHLQHKKVEEVLKNVLYPEDLVFLYVQENYYTIVPRDRVAEARRNKAQNENSANVARTAIKASVISPAVSGVISGAVFEENVEKALVGVTVRVVGRNRGCTTNAQGKFSLKLSPGTYTLEFSSVGYKTKQVPSVEVTPNEVTNLSVPLKMTMPKLTEAVVIGYGTQTRKDLTGSVGTYKPTDEVGGLPLSIDHAMIGKIAGVHITPSSGVPGSASAITIRGISTLNMNGNSPLIVVDGVPVYGINNDLNTTDFGAGNVMGFTFGGTQTVNDFDVDGSIRNSFEKNPLATINPDDIASIEVLKDAYAMAIYGSRGAAGVILITTKKGKPGEMRTNVDLSTTVGSAFDLPDLMTGDQYADFYTTYFHALDTLNQGNWGYPKDYVFPKGINTNWLDEVTRSAVSKNVNVSISGGTENNRYYVSGGLTDRESYIINQDYKRYHGRVHFDQDIGKLLKIGTDINLTYANNEALNAQTVYRNALIKSPNQKVQNPDGSFIWGKGINPIGPTSDVNPVAKALLGENYLTETRVLGNVFAELSFTPWLKLKTKFGVDWISSKGYSRQVSKPHTLGGVGNETSSQLRKWVINNTLTFDKVIGSRHYINAMIGQSFETSDENVSTIWGRDFLNDNIKSISAASEHGIQSALEKQWALLSYFGRINYQFEHKYLLGVTYRIDGSSKFAANHRYVGFPSFSAGWRINKEGFLSDVKAIDQLKVRGSLGFSGSDGGAGYYGNQGQYKLDVYGATYGNLQVISTSQPANPNLEWEKTRTFDVGLDLSLWNSRLMATVDYYNKQISNAILPSALPAFMGFLTQPQNLADVSNRGWEFSINTQNVQNKTFTWSSRFNISHNKNIIKKLFQIDPNDLARNIEINGGRFWRVGKSATEFYLYQWGGVNSKTGNPIWVGADGQHYDTPFPIQKTSDGKYIDANIYLQNRVALGDAMPDFYGGLDNTFKWRNFVLDVFFSFSYGNKMFNGSKAALYNYTSSSFSGASINNLSSDLLQYWTRPGQKTAIPALINKSNYANASFSSSFDYTLGQDISRFLEDASYLKLRNVTLAYNFSNDFLRHKLPFIRSLRVYAQGNNLWLLTEYSGIDPEVSAYGSSALNAGYDELTMPSPRRFTFGIKVGL